MVILTSHQNIFHCIEVREINICENCIIGAGATVVKNITKSGTYVGCPAGLI